MKRLHLTSQKAFTMIEVLVTVSIIVLLSVIGLSVFGTAQQNNRDQKRLRDLNSLRQALEVYRHEKHYYASSSAIQFSCPPTTDFSDASQTYMDQLPADPSCSASRNYVYQALPSGCSGSDCTGYVVCAKKEGSKTYDTPSQCSSLTCSGTDACDMGFSSI
ncbi:MAG: type II secretion system GspH family protein [Patescibacteria group bacterium]|nr:type II secretion system GspH family protein [Patescibacteria group bacterium]